MKELDHALKAMAKAKTVEEKEAYSWNVNNLSESLGVFFNAASEMMVSMEDEDRRTGDLHRQDGRRPDAVVYSGADFPLLPDFRASGIKRLFTPPNMNDADS